MIAAILAEVSDKIPSMSQVLVGGLTLGLVGCCAASRRWLAIFPAGIVIL